MNGPSPIVRRMVWRRERWQCVRCGRETGTSWSGDSIHHRIPRSHPFPGLHEPSNLILLCGSGTTGCHGWVHAHPGTAYRMGWLVHNWANPESTPVYSHRHGWMLLDQEGEWTPCPPPHGMNRRYEIRKEQTR